MHKLTRREFLKLGGMAAAALMAPRWSATAALLAEEGESVSLPASQGRITTWWAQTVRESPSPTAQAVATKRRDEVIPLYNAVMGEPPWPTNPVWYETAEGYIHSGYVQPVETNPQNEIIAQRLIKKMGYIRSGWAANAPLMWLSRDGHYNTSKLLKECIISVPETRFWSQVCVPFAEARWRPDKNARVAYKLYYGTVYRVVDVAPDENDEYEWWYQLQEGITHAPGPYVPTWSVRRLSPEMLAPIDAGVDDKWMEIDIDQQTLTCYLGDAAVFHTRIASGLYQTATPRGEFRVLYKRKTRRMIGADYDLPGVPFPVYFAGNGIALHGTYWHNDYGRRHSHGCVNVSDDAAQWIFRWVDPVTSYDVYTEEAEEYEDGTRVVVV